MAHEAQNTAKGMGEVVLTGKEVEILMKFLWSVNGWINQVQTSNRAFNYSNRHEGTNIALIAVPTLGQQLAWEVNIPVKRIFEKINAQFLDECPDLRIFLREVIDPVPFDPPDENVRPVKTLR